MDIIVLFNGLGNQMSQYALYLNKKKVNKSTYFIFDKKSVSIHNGYELEKIFNIHYIDTFRNKILYLLFRILQIKNYPIISKPIIKFLNLLAIKLIVEDDNYDFNINYLKPSRGITFYFGGWHSESYFENVAEDIRSDFKFNMDNDLDNQSILHKIQTFNSVSLHVRRGDYLKGMNFELYGKVCRKEYYEIAIKKMQSLIDKPHFFIFSNDVHWVRENFKQENLTIVDINRGKDSWKDMYLMSQCRHHINSNSTFSWWSAWLNGNKNKIVIVPKFYINDLLTKDFYPEKWIKISDY